MRRIVAADEFRRRIESDVRPRDHHSRRTMTEQRTYTLDVPGAVLNDAMA
jgi:hypothetical protein